MSHSSKKILIIEDDSQLRAALADKFSGEGFNVMQAASGAEGLPIALSEHPDLVLLDVMMPKVDGLTLLKQMRQDAWGKSAVVLVLTNSDDFGTVLKTMQEHVSVYLSKSESSLEKIVSESKALMER